MSFFNTAEARELAKAFDANALLQIASACRTRAELMRSYCLETRDRDGIKAALPALNDGGTYDNIASWMEALAQAAQEQGAKP